MSLRNAAFWTHLVAGLAVGGVVAVMATTGVMMAFERQLVSLAERGAYTSAPTGERLAPSALIAKAREAVPETLPTGVAVRRDPSAPAAVSFGRDRTVFLNPYTGAALGEGSRLRAFLHQVEQVHRYLALGETGKRITGACSLALAALIGTGLYLWLPRRWGKAIALPSFRLRGKARDFNWHNAIGLWAALPLLMITLTGVVMSYEWATRLLFRAAGSEPPPLRGAAPRPGGPRPERSQAPVDFTHIDKILKLAEASASNWQAISLRAQQPGAVAVTVDLSAGTRPNQRLALTADLRTGEITKSETFQSYSRGRQLRMWVRPLHTGEAGGVFGQAVSALASLGALVLIWTGFALAWRRSFKRSSDRGLSDRAPASCLELPAPGVSPPAHPQTSAALSE